MEGVALDHSNKLKPSTIPMTQFHSSLSDESDQDAITTATHLCIIIQFILTKVMITSLLTTVWDHMDGCVSSIYLLSCIDL